MRGRLAALLAVLAIALLAPAAGSAAPPRNFATPSGDARNRAEGRHLAILCYHDVSNDSNAPGLTVSPEFLRRQIRVSRDAGWTFVSLQQVIESRSHPERLPPRALVMTFDDGYRSFRDLAVPILRAERVPVTLAVITGFVEQAPPGMAPLLNWDELNELASDSLVTLVSHSHHLHRYDTSNPYRDTNPSVASRRYILAEARYENREEYRARVRADLDRAHARHQLVDALVEDARVAGVDVVEIHVGGAHRWCCGREPRVVATIEAERAIDHDARQAAVA